MEYDDLARMRHSCAHVMADAVTQLYPGTKLSIGPSIENGFYYDFDLPKPISVEDLPAIEAKMKEVVAQKSPFVCSEIAPAEARRLFKAEPYKLELIDGILAGQESEDGEAVTAPVAILTTYRHGGFVDLCRGPHVENTGQVGAFKLLSIAGAYWRGDERNKMLTRIYGTCFPSQTELDDYLWRLAEAEKRDHRRLGKALDLFSTHQELGGGLVLWHPNGGMVRHLAEEFCVNEHLANGYDLVYSPHIGRANLWQKTCTRR
jgi:threonyl-tRNA synthetase